MPNLELEMRTGGHEFLRITVDGEILARDEHGEMVPIRLAPHRAEVLRSIAARQATDASYAICEILARELAERGRGS
jgi:guanylate kinase